MTTVKDVLIYEALERNKIYKENKKKELSDSKRKLKPQKASEKAIATVSKSKKNKVTGAKVTKMHKAIKKTKTDTNYKQDFLISRGYDIGDYIPCEIPLCGHEAVDIHHISKSMRGVRQHKEDGSDLIALCRDHHEKIHNRNTYDNRSLLVDLVRYILYTKAINEGL